MLRTPGCSQHSNAQQSCWDASGTAGAGEPIWEPQKYKLPIDPKHKGACPRYQELRRKRTCLAEQWCQTWKTNHCPLGSLKIIVFPISPLEKKEVFILLKKMKPHETHHLTWWYSGALHCCKSNLPIHNDNTQAQEWWGSLVSSRPRRYISRYPRWKS